MREVVERGKGVGVCVCVFGADGSGASGGEEGRTGLTGGRCGGRGGWYVGSAHDEGGGSAKTGATAAAGASRGGALLAPLAHHSARGVRVGGAAFQVRHLTVQIGAGAAGRLTTGGASS